MLGLALYGYKVSGLLASLEMESYFYLITHPPIVFAVSPQVMKTIGYKLTALSPTRGASAELAASLTVVTASYIGLPVSIYRPNSFPFCRNLHS